MNKQSFMRIYDNKQTRLHYALIHDAILSKQMEMSEFCIFDPAHFEDGDATTTHEHTGKMIIDLVLHLRKEYNEPTLKLPITSLYRKGFSLIGPPGHVKKIDYLDMTVEARLAHYGLAFDVSFRMWVNDMNKSMPLLQTRLKEFGFEQPFAWELHHYCPKEDVTIKRFGLLM